MSDQDLRDELDRSREQAGDRLGHARRRASEEVRALIAEADAEAHEVLDRPRGARVLDRLRGRRDDGAHLPALAPQPDHPRERRRPSVPRVRDDRAGRWLIPGVVAAALLAAALAVRGLGTHPLWYDEAFSVLFAQTDWAYFWERSWAKELNAVAYYALLRGWMGLFGYTETALRALSVLIVVATVPVVALLARRLFGERAAIAAALLFAAHGGMLRYAHETRTYTLATLLVTVAAYYFVVGVQDGRWRAWLGFSVAAAVGVYAHLYAVLVAVALVASLVALPRRAVPWRQVAVALGVYGVLVLPSAVFLPQAETVQFDWVAGQLDGVFDRSLFFLSGNANTLVVRLTLVLAAAVALSWARRVALRGQSAETWNQALVVSWAFLPLLLAFGVSQVRPMLVPRYLIVAVPGVVLTVTAVLRLIWGPRTLALVVAGVVALQVIALPSQLYGKPTVDEDWRGLADAVLAQTAPDDALIVVPAYQRVPLEYYLTLHPVTARDPADLPVPLSPPDPWGRRDPYGGFGQTVTDALDAHQRVWLVFDGDRTRPELVAQAEALAGWELVDEAEFGELALRRYERG